ncbi:hypothetical protein KKG83_05635 [Candidatus Micrarchaeota archaeon]|nr:hypothetical protein [Candidatus Micrarchaeota archaeon]MBU2476925.1 hypothetical protein [Candidatus Micrarchaeota archaeon]
MGIKNIAEQTLYSFKPKEKLKGLIPSRHMALWKLIAEGSLAVIVIVSLFEVAHYIFHVEFSEEFFIALEVIDYSAILILAVDLLHHYTASENKPTFVKNKFLYILSFIPYLILHKAMGFVYLLKPVLTGIAKVIKVFSHKDEIKERAEDIKEKIDDAAEDLNKKKKGKKKK